MKAYTDIEQSKKLVELGIDVNTADMWYPPSLIKYGVVNKWLENPTIIKDIEHSKLKKEYYVPCWSLAAMLNVLPEIQGGYPVISLYDNYIAYPHMSNLYTEADNLVDACVEMILKLHEQNIL